LFEKKTFSILSKCCEDHTSNIKSCLDNSVAQCFVLLHDTMTKSKSVVVSKDSTVGTIDDSVGASTRGAVILIALQFASRCLTFLANQVLLRFLAPEILGVSAQLDLFANSVLIFARETPRIVVQRQRPGDADEKSDEIQTIINASHVSILLGIPLTIGFAALYLRNASLEVLKTPYFHQTLALYSGAVVIELLAEPCFVVLQHKLLYKTRASAEAAGSVARCFVTCLFAVMSSGAMRAYGGLGFGLGYLVFSIVCGILQYRKCRTVLHPEEKLLGRKINR
jgi:oligosaccharide translocation protein RFT1